MTRSRSQRIVDSVCNQQAAYYRHVARSSLVASRMDHEIEWVCTGRDSFYNSVLQTRASSSRADVLIEETVAQFAERGAARFSWRVHRRDSPPDLSGRLLASGFRAVEVGPLMVIDCRRFANSLTRSRLAVSDVGDRLRGADWAQVVVLGFGLSPGSVRFHSDWLDSLGYEGPVRSVVGYRGEEPVAAAQIFVDRGIAGVYCVATIPTQRRKGHGEAITRAALHRAATMGARRAVLHANAPAVSMYRRLGFQDVGSVRRYVWLADREVARPTALTPNQPL